jgi:hypothetical protein
METNFEIVLWYYYIWCIDDNDYIYVVIPLLEVIADMRMIINRQGSVDL